MPPSAVVSQSDCWYAALMTASGRARRASAVTSSRHRMSSWRQSASVAGGTLAWKVAVTR